MRYKVFKSISNIYQNGLFKNSAWGIIAQLCQTIFASLFFVIIARAYNTQILANFIIATVLYQLITAFSSLGLNQWFIREITGADKKQELITKFFKLQIYSSTIFYAINVILGLLIYDDSLIQILTILLGLNIVFDNLINAIKCINISEFNQKKSFVIFSTEAILKLAATCFLLFYPFSIVTLSVILILIRFVTLNLFMTFGSSRLVNITSLIQYNVSFSYIKKVLSSNWAFIIIGSVSIINWRIAAIIISKVLSSNDVANYEISYRIFSVATMLPIVVSASIFPVLVKYFKEGKMKEFSNYYRKLHLFFLLFGLFSFTFIYSFADTLIPIVFGMNYENAASSTKQMFFTMLIFPTAFLQANVFVAIKLEKTDMWLNVISLVIYLSVCLVGLYFLKSLAIVNISIFTGFLAFHLLQDILLISQGISSIKEVIKFYLLSILAVSGYILLSQTFNSIFLFNMFWPIVILIVVGSYYTKLTKLKTLIFRKQV